jgi:hypothetical protein
MLEDIDNFHPVTFLQMFAADRLEVGDGLHRIGRAADVAARLLVPIPNLLCLEDVRTKLRGDMFASAHSVESARRGYYLTRLQAPVRLGRVLGHDEIDDAEKSAHGRWKD